MTEADIPGPQPLPAQMERDIQEIGARAGETAEAEAFRRADEEFRRRVAQERDEREMERLRRIVREMGPDEEP